MAGAFRTRDSDQKEKEADGKNSIMLLVAKELLLCTLQVDR
jgi:hypothetical protein